MLLLHADGGRRELLQAQSEITLLAQREALAALAGSPETVGSGRRGQTHADGGLSPGKSTISDELAVRRVALLLSPSAGRPERPTQAHSPDFPALGLAHIHRPGTPVELASNGTDATAAGEPSPQIVLPPAARNSHRSEGLERTPRRCDLLFHTNGGPPGKRSFRELPAAAVDLLASDRVPTLFPRNRVVLSTGARD